MILGIGVDICNVERLAQLRRKYGARFLDASLLRSSKQRWCDEPGACQNGFARASPPRKPS